MSEIDEPVEENGGEETRTELDPSAEDTEAQTPARSRGMGGPNMPPSEVQT